SDLPDPQVGDLDEVPATEQDRAGDDLPVVREETHQRECLGRLPAAALPARPRASPSSRSKETPSTACTAPDWVAYSMTRSLTSRSRAYRLRNRGFRISSKAKPKR